MKILGISGGSKNGANDAMCREALMGAKETGAEVEFIHLLDLNLKPCTGCLQCVAGPSGMMNGGAGACVLKDDFKWLNEKYLAADGIIFAMPIYEKGTPGVFEIIRDRMAGPQHDTGLLSVAQKIAEQKGTAGPDPRHFKKRFVSFIGIGASDWASHMASDFGLFAMTAPMQIIDNLIFNWSKSIIADDAKIARIREAGRSIAMAVKDPDHANYLGSPGVCSHCHSSLMFIHEDLKTVECSVCGIKGELKIEDSRVKFEFALEQLEHAHNTMSGKLKHMDDVQRVETTFAELKKTDLFKQRQDAYKSFIRPSVPDK